MTRRALCLLLISLFSVAGALQLARGLDAAMLPAAPLTPMLTLGKVGPAYALPGDPIAYTLTLTNSGATTATDIIVVDELPAGATYASGGQLFESVIEWSLVELAPDGGVALFTFTVTATETITNEFYQAASSEGAQAFGEDVVVTTVGEPVLSIGKTGPAYAPAGAPITYTVLVTNAGAVPATGLVVTDAIPTGAGYLAGGTLVGDVVSWTVPALPAGQTADLAFAVTATADITNSAYAVAANAGYGAEGTALVPTAVSSPTLTIGKSGPAFAFTARPITYTLAVTNSGTMTATNLVITDQLPVGAGYVGGGALVGDVVRWALPTLGPSGGVTTVQFVVTATAPITNAVYGVTSAGGFGAVGTEMVTTFVGAPDLAIGKAGPVQAFPGEIITYTLALTNSGTLTATNLVITDQLPLGASYVSGGTLVGDVVSWTVPALAPGANLSRSFAVTASETITNATYAAAADDGFGAQGAEPVTTLVGEPDLSLVKEGPAAVFTGAPITYSLWVTNSGELAATNLVITDRVPLGASYLSGGTLVGDVISWTVPALPAGDGVNVGFAVTATATITNETYAVAADDGYGAVGTLPVVTQVGEPALVLTKRGPAVALSEQPITYTLAVTNSGTLTATNLVITDQLPAGASYVSGGTLIGDVVSWTVPALPIGDGSAVGFVVIATAPITNAVYGVTSDGGFNAMGMEPVTTFVGAPQLAIGKMGPSSALIGAPITYTLAVTNSGTLTATNLVITDQVPLGASYVSGGTLIGDVVSWTVPALLPGTYLSVSFTVTATEMIINENYAVAADDGFGAVGTEPVVTIVSEPSLAIVKTGPAAVLTGAPITYTLTAQNAGALAATNLVITDRVPLGASYLSGGTLVGDVVSWTVPALAPSGEVSVTFAVTATATITNAVYGVVADGGYAATGAESVVTLVGDPALAIAKFGPLAALAGAPITYTLTVSNSGVVTATNLVITDQVPPGASYVSGGTLVGDVVSWTVPALAPGADVAVSFVVTATDSITNAIYGVIADGGFATSGDAPWFTEVGAPILGIVKSAPPEVLAGELFTYVLSVSNSGDYTATNLIITDQIPAGASYVSGGDFSAGVVTWSEPSLPPGETLEVFFVVEATETVVNETYAVTATGGFGATGATPVTTVVTPRLLYLPLQFNDYVYGEPNDACDDAHPVYIGQPDYFLADDLRDWYVFDLAVNGEDLSVTLTDFAPIEGQIVVYKGDTCGTSSIVGQNGDFLPDKTVTIQNAVAGRYYILVFNDGVFDDENLYELLTTTE